jgi:hypothetical protein
LNLDTVGMTVEPAAAVCLRHVRQPMRGLEPECLRNLHLVPDKARSIRNLGPRTGCYAVPTGIEGWRTRHDSNV